MPCVEEMGLSRAFVQVCVCVCVRACVCVRLCVRVFQWAMR